MLSSIFFKSLRPILALENSIKLILKENPFSSYYRPWIFIAAEYLKDIILWFPYSFPTASSLHQEFLQASYPFPSEGQTE